MTPRNKSHIFGPSAFMTKRKPLRLFDFCWYSVELPKASSKRVCMSPVEGEQSQGVFFTLQIHLTPKPTIIRLLTTLKCIFWKRLHHRNPQFPPKISCVIFRAKLPKASEYSTFHRKNNPTAYFSGDVYAPRIPL